MSLEGQTLYFLLLLYSLGSQLSFDMIKLQLNIFIFEGHLGHQRSVEVSRGQQNVNYWIRCCSCIPGVPSFRLICIKPQSKHFHFLRSFRSLEVVRGHQKVKHWICCCYCIPWVPSFRLICIKPQLKYFYLWRSLEVVKVQFYFILEFRTLIRPAAKKLYCAICQTRGYNGNMQQQGSFI